MGIISDILEGKVDYVHGDSDSLSDTITWPYPKKNTITPKDEEEKKTSTSAEEFDEIPHESDEDR